MTIVYPRYGITIYPGKMIIAYTWDSDSIPDVSGIYAILGIKAKHVRIWDRVLQQCIEEYPEETLYIIPLKPPCKYCGSKMVEQIDEYTDPQKYWRYICIVACVNPHCCRAHRMQGFGRTAEEAVYNAWR